MNWKEHVIMDEYKMIYKGIDIGISPEFIQDSYANCFSMNDDMMYEEFERRYIASLCYIRDKKIDEILS